MLASAVALAASLATAAGGGTWALAPFEGVNVGAGHVAAAQEVLRQHLEALGQAVVVLEAGGTDPVAPARARGASAVIRGTLTRLGQKVKVRLALQPLEGTVATAALDAGTPEDLDPVLMRIARHFVHGEPLQDPRVSEVTESESDAFNRKRANSYLGVAVSGMPAVADGYSTFLAGASAYWLYDARRFFASVEAGFASGQGTAEGGWGGISVSLLYPFLDRDTSPFVGGGVGYGRLDVGGASNSGLVLFADVGAIFGRTSTTHVRADLKPFLSTFTVEDWRGEPRALVSGAQLSVGVGF